MEYFVKTINSFIVKWIYLSSITASLTWAQMTLVGNVHMKGVTGSVTITEASGSRINVTAALTGLNKNYKWHFREIRVVYDVLDKCTDSQLGLKFGNTEETMSSSGSYTKVISGIDLKSLTGRSIVFVDDTDTDNRFCATLEPDETHITAIVRLPSVIAGTVVFRQAGRSSTSPTSLFTDLYQVIDTDNATQQNLAWHIHPNPVAADTNHIALNNRCANLGNGDVDLSSIFKTTINVGVEKGQHMRGFTDTGEHLPLQGDNTIVGRSLSISASNGTILSCGTIRLVRERSTETVISRDGVKGYIKLTQASLYDVTKIEVNLTGLQAKAGGYHVHKWPVPQQLTKSEAMCSPDYVSGHFNPFNVVIANSPSAGTGTNDQYEIGDISGKFGVLNGKSALDETYYDYNLPLFGSNSVIGRSFVIHKSESGGPRWVCANIVSKAEMRTAQIMFRYPVIGYMVFQQPVTDWYYAETQIYVELDVAVSPITHSTGHKWHVHVSKVNNDSTVDTSRCMSVGGHYNPYNVDLTGNYLTNCSTASPLRCEVGDLAGKHGPLDVRTNSGQRARNFFTDVDLPLSGPLSIIGRSVVIHGKDQGGARVSCADIYELPKRVVKVDTWSKNEASSIQGTVKISENSPAALSGDSNVEFDINGLQSQAGGLHVHVLPVPVGATSPCSPTSVGGHFNPFDVNISNSPANGTGSDDQYEIGDLSGRYGNPLNDQSMVKLSEMDTNLPLRGPLSVVGRSIVIHKSSGSRWICGDIVEDTSTTRGMLYQSKATFTEGPLEGHITLMQYRYPDGGMSDTSIIVDLYHKQNRSQITKSHNWHVHVHQFQGDAASGCSSPGGHFNPFHVTMDTNLYKECSFTNPLRCEVGDQASKLGSYDIGSGRKFYTDVNLPLMGEFGVTGRSFVIHGENSAAGRIACADIIPVGGNMMAMTFITPTNFDKNDMKTTIAAALNTPTYNLMVEPMSSSTTSSRCSQAMVYFIGPESSALYTKLHNLVNSDSSSLGAYEPKCCGSSTTVSLVMIGIFLCLQRIISKWT